MEDELAPARGLVNGLLLAVVFWGFVAYWLYK